MAAAKPSQARVVTPPPPPSPPPRIPTPIQTQPSIRVQPLSMAASSPSCPLSIAEKLSDSNFLLWKQQIDPIITSHRMQSFLVNPDIPQKYLSDHDRVLEILSPEYLIWEQQDAYLLTWLQSTLTKEVLLQMIGCKHSYQLWERLHSGFFSLTEAKSRELRLELRGMKLGSKGVSDYLQQIKMLCDSLSSIGDSVSEREQTDVILAGLPSEYESICNLFSMTRKLRTFSIQEIGAILLAQEVRNEKTKLAAVANFSSCMFLLLPQFMLLFMWMISSSQVPPYK